MTITVNTKAYTEDAATSSNVIPYVGPDHSISKRDQFILGRTPPVANKTFSGMARSTARLVRTLPLTGAVTETGLATVEVTVNFPVGSATVDQEAMIDDIAAGVAQQWFTDLGTKQDIKA